jgi:predicted transposase YdaD
MQNQRGFLQQEASIHAWKVVVITPSRQLNFGASEPVAEFLECRVQWVELLPERWLAGAPLFQRLLALLVRPEAEIPEAVRQLRQQAPAATPLEASSELLTLIPTILLARFTDRPLQEICAMAGLTIEDFTQSVAYREIFGQGRQEGRQEGRRDEAAAVTIRLLNRRCGPLSGATTAQIQALPVDQLEALADALLDFQGPADLAAWLAANAAATA